MVLHTVGPVLVEAYKQHPNITAILWAGLPGQESGNALVDVLYGRVNPQAKSPFTWGKKESDWGPDAKLMYQAPPGTGGFSPNSPAPQQEFPEGVFIDYRHFDRGEGIEPSYEFGFGLSYTTFAYSELAIEKFEVAGAPAATADVTVPAPILGTINFSDPVGAGYLMPQGFDPVPRYVYPWLSNSSRVLRSGNASVSPAPRPPSSLPQAAVDGSPQKILSAGGGPGGNPRLYDVLYSVTAVVENTGDVAGTEIPQLVSLCHLAAQPPPPLFSTLALPFLFPLPFFTLPWRTRSTVRGLQVKLSCVDLWCWRRAVVLGPSSRAAIYTVILSPFHMTTLPI